MKARLISVWTTPVETSQVEHAWSNALEMPKGSQHSKSSEL